MEEKSWMTLADVLRVKKMADNINFLRLFYLKSSDDVINQLRTERGDV